MESNPLQGGVIRARAGPELRATIDREYAAMKSALVDLGLAKP